MNDDLSEAEQEVLSDESETFNEIMKIYQKEIKNKKSYRNSKLPPDVVALMGDTNKYFMFNRFDEAISKAYEIISKYPDYPESYHILGLIHQEQGNKKKAAHFFTLAAQLTQSDARLWEKIGNLYKEAQCYEQACYSFGRALKSDPNNKMLMLERAECYELAGDIRKAIKCIEKFITNTPDNLLIVKKCAKLYTKINQTSKSIELLENFLKHEQEVDFNIVNMICELYIKDGLYAECISFLNRTIGVASEQDSNESDLVRKKLQEAPLEITIKYGLCSGKINRKDLTNVAFEVLMKEDISQFPDFFEEAAETYEQLEEYEKAVKIYEKLVELPEYNSSDTWLKIGVIYRKMGGQKSAKDAFNAVIEKNPEEFEAKVHLSEIYVSEGKMNDALNILRGADQHEVVEPRNDDVFLSDDEGGAQNKDKQYPMSFRKRSAQFQDDIDDGEEIYKMEKLENKAYKKVQKPQKPVYTPKIIQNETPKSFKLTKESIENKISEIQGKYPIEPLILKFKQARILLESNHEKEFLDVIVEPLIQSLKLEIEIHDIRAKVLNRFLYESQKKSFKRRVESGQEFDSREVEQNVLLKTKKTKIPSDILQKRKAKFSAYLTDKQFENVRSISKEFGKVEYYSLNATCLELLDKRQEYKKSAIICELLVKLKGDYVKEEKLSHLLSNVYIYGFTSNYQLKQYENAFYYIKYFSKSRTDDNFVQTLLAISLQHLEDPAVYRVFMSKVQIKELDKECEAITQILANNYLQTGFYELCINTTHRLYKKDETNPYTNLLLGVAFLQSACSRTTPNKPQMVLRALQCFNSYFDNRANTHPCESYYNLGRVYSQLSMFKNAIECYNKVIDIHYERVMIWDNTFKEKRGLPQCDNLVEKAVCNLIMIHNRLGNTDIVKQLIADFMHVTD